MGVPTRGAPTAPGGPVALRHRYSGSRCPSGPLAVPPTFPHIVIGGGDDEREEFCGEKTFNPFRVGDMFGDAIRGRRAPGAMPDSRLKIQDGLGRR